MINVTGAYKTKHILAKMNLITLVNKTAFIYSVIYW